MSRSSERQSLSANQISSTYFNWRLRYNYFRFWKTNFRHIGNLLSVSTSTICQKSAHYSASWYRISSKSKHPLRKWRHFHFSRWRPRPLNTSSGFVFVDVTVFRKSKSISKPNFVDISQLTAEISLLPLLKNKLPPYWKSTFGFNFDYLPEICTLFCIRIPDFVQIEHPLRKYDVISISQDGGRDGWILLPVSYLLMSLPSKRQVY